MKPTAGYPSDPTAGPGTPARPHPGERSGNNAGPERRTERGRGTGCVRHALRAFLRQVLPAAILAASSACSKATSPIYRDEAGPNSSIARLKSLCSNTESQIVDQETVVCGFIVGNDRYGEFRRTIVLEDPTGGIFVALDGDGLSELFPFGHLATLHCTGLTLATYGGKTLIGERPGPYGVEPIPRERIARYLTVVPPGEERHEAREVSIGQIGPQHIDTRVRIDGIRFVETGAAWCDTDPETGRTQTTVRTIVDDRGNTLAVRTLGSCSYAKEPLPEGRGSIYGVVDYFNGTFSLRVTNRDLLFPNAGAHPTTYPSAGRCSAPTPTR